VAEIRRAAPHDKAQHHLRRAVFSIGSPVHRAHVKTSSLSFQAGFRIRDVVNRVGSF
jgi:hypothetical protein